MLSRPRAYQGVVFRWKHAKEFWRTLAALACVSFAALPTFASPPMYFDRFDRDAGLSQLAVHSIAEDRTGYLWLGTEDGFDRYDGYTFQHATGEASDSGRMTSDYVADIAVDDHDALWLATDGDGVLRREPSTGRFEPLTERVDNRAASVGLERVRTVHFDRHGILWIGSRNAGIARLDPRTRKLERFRAHTDGSGPSSDSVFTLFEDRSGTLWAGTEAGLDRFDTQEQRFIPQPLPFARRPPVHAVLEDGLGALWVGTSAGLVRLDHASRAPRLYVHASSKARSLPSDAVNALLQDRAGRLWVGTTAGLALFDRATDTFDVYRNDPADAKSLPDDNILSLFEDRNGLIWVGTQFGGLAKWNPRTWSFGHNPARPDAGFASRNIMAITEDRAGRLWIGTFDGGIAIMDRSNRRVVSLRKQSKPTGSLSDDRVMALITDRGGAIWAGTMGGGLNRIDAQTHRVTAFRHRAADPESLGADGVMSLFEDSRDRLWIGTYGGGLSRLDRATGKFRRYIAGARVTAIAEDPSGLLWVGTDGGGLNVLDPSNGSFHPLQHDPENLHSLSTDTVYTIHVDAHGRVWVGTRGGGLNRVMGDPRNPQAISFEHITEKDGLPNGTIYGIRSDAQGALWVSTNYGLARVDPESGEARAFHRSHGLQGEEFSYGAHYANARGEIFFGGANGFNAFAPGELEFNALPPEIVLTSLSFPNRPPVTAAAARSTRGLRLGYHDDTITLEFAALDFAAPLNNRFKYWLEGSNRSWVDAGTRRTVTYSNLPGGFYTLHVRAANSDGTWNLQGLSIPMHVDPPPWRSPWAYTAYVALLVLACLGGWGLIRYRLKSEARRREVLETLVRERTRELATHAQALELANQRLEEASFTDPLTGLGNRRSLRHTMPQMIANMPRSERLALMVVDLDYLKPINDEHGHEAGDRVLVHVSRILRDCLHGVDAVVRWGGDEFVVVHSCTNLEAAAQLAERIRIAVSTHRYHLIGSSIARTSCSIGFAMYPFVRAVPGLLSWEEVLRLADAALYRAKSRRNAWVGWSGRKAAHDLATQISADPEAAEANSLIRSCSSDVTSGETIDLLLRRPMTRGGRA